MTTIAQKGYRGMGMEGLIARWYEKNTRRDLPEYRKLAERLAAMAPDKSSFLEVAPGPGFLAIELARSGKFSVTGLDISETFVQLARQNAQREGVTADFRLGNASAMPFGSDSFDFVVCRAAFKNFSEPVRALQEMHRVLRPGGRTLIIDLRRDVSRRSIDEYVDRMGMAFFNRSITKLTFRFMLLKRAYTKEELEQMLPQTKFRKTEIQEAELGFELWLTK